MSIFSKILARRAYVDAMHNDLIYLAQPGGSLSGTIRVRRSDKWVHIARSCSAPGRGHHRSDFLEARTRTAAIQAFRDMGVVIEGPQNGRVTVYGVGLHGLRRRLGRSTWVTPVLPCVCSAVCWRGSSRSTAP